ncbi:MAG: hypothetical protein HRT35_06115 [Algicola sp.]|nr:hypothetical protein [Algicola sp.]
MMTKKSTAAINAVSDSLTQIIDSLQFVTMTLGQFVVADDEELLNAAELSGLTQYLNNTRDIAENCYTQYCYAKLTLSDEMPEGNQINEFVAVMAVPPSENPIITGTTLGTLTAIVNSLQFLTAIFERVELAGDERLLTQVEVAGLNNTVKGIMVAAEYCFAQFYDAPL